jgi:four helix bundle protein
VLFLSWVREQHNNKEMIMNNQSRKFDFERLIVFQRTLELIEVLKPLLDAPPRRAGKICEDLDRSSQSITFNIAEGAGRQRGTKDRTRFYNIALGSAKEAAAQIIVLDIRGFISRKMYTTARALLIEIVSMLTAMTK